MPTTIFPPIRLAWTPYALSCLNGTTCRSTLILRAYPSTKLSGVIASWRSRIVILAFLPWLDTSRVRSARYRPLYKRFFWLFVIVCVGLGWLGSKPPEGIYVILARVFTHLLFRIFSDHAARNFRKDKAGAEFNFGISAGRDGVS